jgi:hypothetical protein
MTLFQVRTVEPATPPREVRQISAEIVLPVNALIETLVNLLTVLKQNNQLQRELHSPVDNIIAALAKISLTQ